MNSVKGFSKRIAKLSERDIIILSGYINNFEKTLNDCQVDRTTDQGGIKIFHNTLTSMLIEYLGICGYIRGDVRNNQSKPLVRYIYWLLYEVNDCSFHKPCTTNNVYANHMACTEDRQVAIRFSLASLKDLIMVNIPYELWCTHFTKKTETMAEINPNHIKEIKAKYLNKINDVIASPFERFYSMEDKYCEIKSLTEKCEAEINKYKLRKRRV